MIRALRMLALGSSLVALAVMMLPTWRVSWSGSTPWETVTTRERWMSPLLFGYGDVLAPFAVLATVVAALAALVVVVRDLRGAWPDGADRDGEGEASARRDGAARSAGSGPAIRVVAAASLLALIAAIAGGVLFGGLAGPAILAPVCSAVAAASSSAVWLIGRRG